MYLHREQKTIFKASIENSMGSFTKNVSKRISEGINKIKNYKELYVSLDYKELEEKMIVALLSGYADSSERHKWWEYAQDKDPFDLPFEDAIKYLVEKDPVLFEKMGELTLEVKNKFKWVKKSTDLEITKRMFESLDENMKNGGTFMAWKKDIQEAANKAGFGDQGYYLENIYRTNIINAYNMGTYKEQMETKEDFPYLLYDAVSDEDTTEICKRLDGKIYRSDDPIWDEIYPGNHYQCRSGVISISKEEYEEEGYSLSKKDADVIKKLEKTDFKGNPGTIWNKIEKGVKIKEKVVKTLERAIEINFANIRDEKAKAYFEKAFIDSPEEIKKIASNYSGELTARIGNGSYYRPGANYIELGGKKIHMTTVQHEFGHFIDDIVARKMKKGISNKLSKGMDGFEGFAEAMDKAKKSLLRSKANIQKRKDLKNFALEKFTQSELRTRNYSDFQDILNGISKGKVQLCYGHSDAYWKRENSPESETFANMFALYSRKDKIEAKRQIEFLEEFFPGLFGEFSKIIKKVSELK